MIPGIVIVLGVNGRGTVLQGRRVLLGRALRVAVGEVLVVAVGSGALAARLGVPTQEERVPVANPKAPTVTSVRAAAMGALGVTRCSNVGRARSILRR